jgi:hypothetical protein
MTRRLHLPLLMLILAVLACNVPSGAPGTPTASLAPGASPETVTSPPAGETAPAPTETPTGPAGSPPAGGLTLDMLRNGTYHAPYYDRTVTLVNGLYSEGTGGYSVRMLDVYAFGDLTGDHQDDAAIILAENDGGSGVFESVVAVNLQSGAVHQISQWELGDRVQISSADISSGVIHLSMMVQGPSDPLCCPTLPQRQNFWLIGNVLRLMRVTSTIGGTEHAINVTSPGNWVSVTNPFTVNGNVSVAPFENTLAYKIYLVDWTVVNESSLIVNSSGMFSKSFDFSAAGITGFVIIQFADYSAADGSLQALGSVIVDLH